VRKGLPPGYYTMKLARDGAVEMYDPGPTLMRSVCAKPTAAMDYR
jgi:hypothetical protein